ncbi:hypothetical protein D9M71_566580 [compost metagenome]
MLKASEMQFFLSLLVNDSIACTIASMPVIAVMAGGTPNVSVPSRSATSGSSRGDTTPFFSSFGVVRMEIGVTSEPVPAVVGT